MEAKAIDISTVPRRPGVYVFKGPKEKVLYVGKAKNLRNRLKSYFRKGADLDVRKTSMVRGIRDFSFIVTANEMEALALEANLIKQYKPRYNVVLRDDKNYPYLKVTLKEEWPRLEVVRRIIKDGSLYFGPYVPTGGMWETLSFIRRHFNIRPCRYRLDKPMRPCIQYQMGRCPAPCAGYVDRADYLRAVNEVVMFLKGRKGELINELERRMEKLSDEQRYEAAAAVRDRLAVLRRAWESQKVIAPELGDMDVFGYHEEGGRASFQVFFIRNGVMIGAKDFYLKDVGGIPIGELLHGFLEIFYAKEIIPPDEIVLGAMPEGAATLARWLKEKRGGNVEMAVPKRGKKMELLRMANENAGISFRGRAQKVEGVLRELSERFSIAPPHDIGAFDVSTIAGAEPVGAFVCWSDGDFRKDLYRHMKIKTVAGMDDYAMMAETVKRTLEDIRGKWPGLILIDGGKGQLEAVRAALRDVEGGERLAVMAVAKDPDRVFAPHLEEPVDIGGGEKSYLLLRAIRDEVHRFAIGFHKKLRGKRFMASPLENIPGIGKKRRLALLRRFGSIAAIREAEVEEIARVDGMNRKAAQAVLAALRA